MTLKDKMDYYCNDWNIPEEQKLAETINKDIKEAIKILKIEITLKLNSLNSREIKKVIDKVFGDFEK